jgi:predicted transcriptional regulator
MNSNGNDPYLTAKIVSKYVGYHKLAPGQLSDLITTVHQALGQVGQPNKPDKIPIAAVSVRRSVHHDYVVCLDCGFRAITLRRHIRVQHNLSPDEYLQRWGLKSNHPLVAPAYSERRSTMAKELGLGRKPSIQVAPTATPAKASMPVTVEAGTQPTSKRKYRTRRATKSSDVASEVVATPTPARRGRPRSRAVVAS